MKILPKVPDDMFVDWNKLGDKWALGYCAEPKEIFLCGKNADPSIWLKILIHELHHKVLHEMGLKPIHHHPIIDEFESSDRYWRFKNATRKIKWRTLKKIYKGKCC